MIIETEVEIIVNATTYNFWIEKGYTITPHIDAKGRVKTFKKGVTKLLVKVSDLPRQSNVAVTAKCINCALVRKLSFCSYSDTCWKCNLESQKGPKHPAYLQRIKTQGTERAFDIRLRRVTILLQRIILRCLKNKIICVLFVQFLRP